MKNLSSQFIASLPPLHRPYVQELKAEHAQQLGPRLRKADVRELKASSGLDGVNALLRSMENSVAAWVYLNPATLQPHMAGGLVQVGNSAAPWALSAPLVNRYEKDILWDIAPLFINYLHKISPRLSNMVDARNKTAIRWLKFMGFIFGEPQEWGVEKLMFYPFYKEVDNV